MKLDMPVYFNPYSKTYEVEQNWASIELNSKNYSYSAKHEKIYDTLLQN